MSIAARMNGSGLLNALKLSIATRLALITMLLLVVSVAATSWCRCASPAKEYEEFADDVLKTNINMLRHFTQSLGEPGCRTAKLFFGSTAMNKRLHDRRPREAAGRRRSHDLHGRYADRDQCDATGRIPRHQHEAGAGRSA